MPRDYVGTRVFSVGLVRQPLRMPGEMVAHEGRDEIVGMVIAGLAAQRQVDPGAVAGPFQKLRLQLFGQEIVRLALVDEDVLHPCPVLDQRAGIVFAPRLPVRAEIAGQRLLAPRAIERRDDRREGRDGLEPVRVAQGDGQRAMPAH